jgi:hypothetical protein
MNFCIFLVVDFKALMDLVLSLMDLRLSLMDLKFSFSFDGHDLQFKLWNSQIELP